ncbi:MAG: recombinase family protein [Candidatus Levybacteria bacterium]|nr:recombinase family protein [Candidatus Levybacteria bacterium]
MTEETLAYAYMRISSRSQKSKYGLKTQREDIDKAKNSFNLKILRWYKDVCTGRTIQRKEFQQMTEDLKNHPEVKAIVISRTSRLGRNVREMLNWHYELEKIGVKLFVAEGGLIDTDTITGKMNFQIQCVFAEFELNNMTDQLQKGLARWKAEQKNRGV